MINDSSKIIMFIKMCACGGTNVQSSGITMMFTGSCECLQTRLVRHKAVVRGEVHVYCALSAMVSRRHDILYAAECHTTQCCNPPARPPRQTISNIAHQLIRKRQTLCNLMKIVLFLLLHGFAIYVDIMQCFQLQQSEVYVCHT